jgi:putative membrane protein
MMKLLMTATALCVPAAALVAQAPTTAPGYVMMAGASDQYERQSSRLVLETSANPKIKQFATMMITDHNKSTADVAAAAKQSRVAPKPPKLDAQGARDVAALRAARGTARDTLYVQQQKLAHQKALALHQGYSANGDAPALKAVATSVVPVVQHHIEMLSTM